MSDSIHPVMKRIYGARGLTRVSDLELELARLAPVSQMKGIMDAADLLLEALQDGKSILIVGDYDADGATSTALAMLALKAYGAERVSYLVPNRFDYGYGLTPELVELAASYNPGLIITVDNGISSLSGIERANDFGIPVLVTDHHLPPERLPPAAVIVNPNQPDDPFPSKHLAGVGVVFYLMAALARRLESGGWFKQQGLALPNPAQWLDLVAIGTICDLVPLDYNNRVLVAQGLRRIRAGCCRPGIRALAEVAKRALPNLVASDIGFALGPRLNAAGRLDDMGLGIECLLTGSTREAQKMAQQLDSLNQERRSIEQSMKSQADSAMAHLHLSDDGELPAGLCLYDAAWHQGVVGILASRMKTQYHRPVIAFAQGDDGMLKGSARSISGLHMRDLLAAIATRNPGLITRFGGHAMAAGLTLAEEAYPRFKQAFEREAAEQLSPEMLEEVVFTDGELPVEELNLELAVILREGGPWGQGFPEPLFEGCFDLQQQRVVGESHLKLVLSSAASSCRIDAIAFNQPPLSASDRRVWMTYRLDVNEFRGRRSAQLIVETIQSTT
ncbi:MAG: single-stranded-DNA-specific exonuclease RecJ [Candidatus Thiodiazotropha sp. (ex Ctena orbiculata)]|nr:single-stranded-DNA-specific exonuclease RecJ [Candidatus Thiodiazotropha taylori]MBT3036427.1 single-stranded-DNA-specific exonuclease RecJ [Candidatus Thiodiazotropha taylori]PUB84955.1 MAG: single-stranded-DNA-specific exonuclease RecJ [gamma proteobacterium symbiont of Ctena orbiculata]